MNRSVFSEHWPKLTTSIGLKSGKKQSTLSVQINSLLRNAERKTLDTRTQLAGFRDLNIELGEIHKMSVQAEKVINNTIDTKVGISVEL